MSQINDGTVTVTNGSTLVQGDDDADFSAVVTGDLFTIAGTSVWYEVAATALVLGNWQLTLAAPFGGTTEADAEYTIVQSFTPSLRIPYIEQGDTETAAVFKRAMLRVEALLSSVVGATSIANLRALPTSGGLIAENSIRALISPGLIEEFQLQEWDGASVDDGATNLRPDDFDEATNPYIWIKIR